MGPSDKLLHRAAERAAKALIAEQLLVAKEPVAEVERRIFEAMRANFREEAEILREAERILEENKRQTTGMDQRTLLMKIKEKVARERGFVL